MVRVRLLEEKRGYALRPNWLKCCKPRQSVSSRAAPILACAAAAITSTCLTPRQLAAKIGDSARTA